jgi:preprotein translocase subunit SecF
MGNIIKDILKEKGIWSQGRVYLFISIVCYYVTLSILLYKGIKNGYDFELKTFEDIITALQWAMALFAGYVFGGKGLETIKTIMSIKEKPKEKNEEIENI